MFSVCNNHNNGVTKTNSHLFECDYHFTRFNCKSHTKAIQTSTFTSLPFYHIIILWEAQNVISFFSTFFQRKKINTKYLNKCNGMQANKQCECEPSLFHFDCNKNYFKFKWKKNTQILFELNKNEYSKKNVGRKKLNYICKQLSDKFQTILRFYN